MATNYRNQGNVMINSVDVNDKKGHYQTFDKRTNAIIRSSEMHGTGGRRIETNAQSHEARRTTGLSAPDRSSTITPNSLSQNKIPAT